MRRIRGSFWTPERDRRLQAYEAAGMPASAIAERLGTTRDAVLGRSQRLRGLTVTYKAYVQKQRVVRAAADARRREKQRQARAAVARLRAEIAKGIPRDVAIASAVDRGATYQAIVDEVGVSGERVRQIWSGR
jgi:hypothetical protein